MIYMNRGLVLLALLLTTGIMIGCSGGGASPVFPDLTQHAVNAPSFDNEGTPGKAIWGVWDITIDRETLDISVVPLRGAEFTVDVVAFLQYPKGTPANLQLHITDNSDFMDMGILGIGVGLTHPFPGLDQFVGFDVMGVVMGSGSTSSLYNPDVLFSDGKNDLKLLNADGYTRWMNPSEFPPDGTILRFDPGYLGTTNLDLINATIHGYKYYTDGLAEDEDLGGFFQTPGTVQDLSLIHI